MIILFGSFILKACPTKELKSQPKKSARDINRLENWTIEFERTGGIAGFRDRLVLQSDGKGEYFVGKESQVKFDINDQTMERLRWVIGREDLYKAAGEYKKGKVADEITYVMKITKGEQVTSFKWETQSLYPSILDEIRPVFDEILTDARKLAGKS